MHIIDMKHSPPEVKYQATVKYILFALEACLISFHHWNLLINLQ